MPTPQSKSRLKRVFAETHSLNITDIRTRYALGDGVDRYGDGLPVRHEAELVFAHDSHEAAPVRNGQNRVSVLLSDLESIGINNVIPYDNMLQGGSIVARDG